MGTYNMHPEVAIHSSEIPAVGAEEIVGRLKSALGSLPPQERTILAVECYPGCDVQEIHDSLIAPLHPALVLYADDWSQPSSTVQERIRDCITDDRVFGVMSHYTIDQFFDAEQIEAARKQIASAHGLVVVYGVGTCVLCDPDLLVYASITRWEIQLRYRQGMANWKTDNSDEDPLRKFKRGYFFEWRMADRIKRSLEGRIDFLIDATKQGDLCMISGAAWRDAIAQVASQPFRLVPYFDTSVWGGHWMQEHFGLDPDAPNFGWAFDGVPEENSVGLDFGGISVEIPAQDIVSFAPEALLGEKVHARFGCDFPIRFDYLDTMGGGNLSLQVHPLTAYIQDRFGMAYTQDESYYILDATDHSCVYCGLKNGVSKASFVSALRQAQEDGDLDAEQYVNRIPVKKHDHVLIPAGTIHCGGADTVILEISATPYIFTFKLWDWGRLGLDGKPRPINIDRGEPNIVESRDTDYVLGHLVDRIDAEHADLSDEEGVVRERTGLDPDHEFIDTERFWFKDTATLECAGGVNMLNLIEGDTALVESLDGSFDPLEVHYGETFIVPANCGTYRIRNLGDPTQDIAVIRAYVRD